jgi:hypothetical protein
MSVRGAHDDAPEVRRGEVCRGRCLIRENALCKEVQHLPAYVSIRQQTSAYVSISQHTSAYVSIRGGRCVVRENALCKEVQHLSA